MDVLNWNWSLVDGPIAVPILGDPDPETGERPIVGQVAGCHLNVARSALPAAAEAYEVTPDPATPVRLFAGDRRGEDGRWELTALLRFDDAAQATAVMPGLVGPSIEDAET